MCVRIVVKFYFPCKFHISVFLITLYFLTFKIIKEYDNFSAYFDGSLFLQPTAPPEAGRLTSGILRGNPGNIIRFFRGYREDHEQQVHAE